MITLGLCRQMAEEGGAGLSKNQNFFWEEAPLQHDGKPAKGVWLVTRGGDITSSRKGLNLRTTVDFYVAFSNKAQTEAVYAEIQKWLRENKSICELSGAVTGTVYSYDYSNVRVRPTQSPQNAGITENGLIIKVASVLLIYDE